MVAVPRAAAVANTATAFPLNIFAAHRATVTLAKGVAETQIAIQPVLSAVRMGDTASWVISVSS